MSMLAEILAHKVWGGWRVRVTEGSSLQGLRVSGQKLEQRQRRSGHHPLGFLTAVKFDNPVVSGHFLCKDDRVVPLVPPAAYKMVSRTFDWIIELEN